MDGTANIEFLLSVTVQNDDDEKSVRTTDALLIRAGARADASILEPHQGATKGHHRRKLIYDNFYYVRETLAKMGRCGQRPHTGQSYHNVGKSSAKRS